MCILYVHYIHIFFCIILVYFNAIFFFFTDILSLSLVLFRCVDSVFASGNHSKGNTGQQTRRSWTLFGKITKHNVNFSTNSNVSSMSHVCCSCGALCVLFWCLSDVIRLNRKAENFRSIGLWQKTSHFYWGKKNGTRSRGTRGQGDGKQMEGTTDWKIVPNKYRNDAVEINKFEEDDE